MGDLRGAAWEQPFVEYQQHMQYITAATAAGFMQKLNIKWPQNIQDVNGIIWV